MNPRQIMAVREIKGIITWNKHTNLFLLGICVPLLPMLCIWRCKIYVPLNFCVWISQHTAAAAAKSPQSCPTLCDPIEGSPPGSHIPGILQARTLEWVAIAFSNAWKWKAKTKSLSHFRLLATPWTAAHQVPQSMGFSRQEYWSGEPLPSSCRLLKTFNYSLSMVGNPWLFF